MNYRTANMAENSCTDEIVQVYISFVNKIFPYKKY
jgi:hypothetical protein